jgi:hypothetical protein
MDFPLATPELDHDALRFSILLLAQRKSRMKVTLLLLYSELPRISTVPPVFLSRSLSCVFSPLFPHTSFLTFFLQDCVWHEFPHPSSGMRPSTDGWFTPIPSLTLEEPPHLPSWRVIHSRVRELLWSLSK